MKCKDCGASINWGYPSREETADMWNRSVIVSKHPKPCPFCGSEAILKPIGMSRYAWYIGCENPDCEIRPHINTFKTPEDAIKEWNRRARDE